MDSLAHKRPDLRLLEIDGTSMSVSDLLLTALTVKCPESRIISRFAQFDIATGSADELSRIKTRLGDCGSRVSFTALDLEVDFEPSAEFVQYDLIVVCLVCIIRSIPRMSHNNKNQAFHRVSSLEKTLEKLRKMLAPWVEPISAINIILTKVKNLQWRKVDNNRCGQSKLGTKRFCEWP